MRVVFVHPTNPFRDHDAITNYIRGILEHAGNGWIYCGAAPHQEGIQSDSEAFVFHPLFRRSRKLLMPTTLKYQYRLLVRRSSIPIDGSILSVHGVEWAVPMLYPRKIGPVVLTIHGASKFMRLGTPNKAKIAYHELADKLAVKKADCVILVSHDAYEFYRTKYPGIKEKFTYVPTFVNSELFRPTEDREALRHSRGLAPDDVVVMYAGRFASEKGLDLLLAAFRKRAQVSDKVKLVLVGDGPLRNRLQETARGMRNVELWSSYAHRDMPEILNCADLFVLPSLFEATPLVVLEALACGVPVVATAVGDLPRIIVDGVNGCLVRHRTIPDWIQAIDRCLRQIGSFSRNNCSRSVYEYHASTVVPQILRVYSEVGQGI